MSVVKADIEAVLNKARRAVYNNCSPTNVNLSLNRLRPKLAHAMRLDVVMHQRVREVPHESLTFKYWDSNPVWKVATRRDYYKAHKICGLFNEIIRYGFASGIVRELCRLASQFWRLSRKDFDGLCRRVISKISRSLRERRNSPETLERFAALSSNPIFADRVCRPQAAKRRRNQVVSKSISPPNVDLLVFLLEERRKRKRRKKRRRAKAPTLLTQHGHSSIRV